MEIGYSWDVGLLRELNEDSILCVRFDIKAASRLVSAGLFAVADGMGGHNAGEIASDLAIRTFYSSCLSELLGEPPAAPLSALATAFNEANRKVLDCASDRNLRGMGTTLTAALVIEGDLYVVHVGDSRCYIINDRETLQVTKDHSVVQELVDAGVITSEQARSHPRRNELTRVLGYYRDVVPDLYYMKLYAGDDILICSDGLCSVLSSDKIAAAVLSSPSPSQACMDLTAQANLAGGPDNISVIIARPDNLPSWQAVVAAETTIRRL